MGEKKSKEGEQTLAEFNLAPLHLITVRKQNIKEFKAVTLNDLNCSCMTCNKHPISLVGLYGRILTSVVCTDLIAFGLYLGQDSPA